MAFFDITYDFNKLIESGKTESEAIEDLKQIDYIGYEIKKSDNRWWAIKAEPICRTCNTYRPPKPNLNR